MVVWFTCEDPYKFDISTEDLTDREIGSVTEAIGCLAHWVTKELSPSNWDGTAFDDLDEVKDFLEVYKEHLVLLDILYRKKYRIVERPDLGEDCVEVVMPYVAELNKIRIEVVEDGNH